MYNAINCYTPICHDQFQINAENNEINNCFKVSLSDVKYLREVHTKLLIFLGRVEELSQSIETITEKEREEGLLPRLLCE